MSTLLNITIACKAAIEKRVHELRNRDNSIQSRVGPVFRGLWNPDKPCAIGAENHVFEVLAVKLHAVTSTCNLYILIKKAGIPAFFEHFRYFSNFQFNKFFN